MTPIKEQTITARDTVFIVDDDVSICDGLSNLLESVGIPAECYHSAEMFRLRWERSCAGCLLLDARLPGISGVELQEQMRSSGIGIPVIFMTAHGDIPMVRKVMKAGAIEFLTKPFEKDELLHAVRQAFEQDRAQREESAAMGAIRARVDSLSPREREVMAMVIAGFTNKDIAERLHLSVVTIKLHRGQVMRKMQADSLADLVKMSERIGPARNARVSTL
jgi:FixJ family two-component response regulator